MELDIFSFVIRGVKATYTFKTLSNRLYNFNLNTLYSIA